MLGELSLGLGVVTRHPQARCDSLSAGALPQSYRHPCHIHTAKMSSPDTRVVTYPPQASQVQLPVSGCISPTLTKNLVRSILLSHQAQTPRVVTRHPQARCDGLSAGALPNSYKEPCQIHTIESSSPDTKGRYSPPSGGKNSLSGRQPLRAITKSHDLYLASQWTLKCQSLYLLATNSSLHCQG